LEFVPVPDVYVMGTRSELLSAVSNLVSNAIRYTPLGGRIQIHWTSSPEGLMFIVKDSGPGIAAEHLPRLAERFYRVDRSRSRETGGTGLGLAITKHVMQRHGGELRIESVVGQGSTFRLVFPQSRVVVASTQAA
jgi:two-component system phosphate regulon sensor histidine kinase PhoR